MYLRAVHAELNIPALRRFIRENPLGVFTTAFPSTSNFPFIQCTHVPFLLDVSDETSETELGVLRGHMARANPHSKSLVEHFQNAAPGVPTRLEQEVMILFNGPHQHYITPKFYTETKPRTGKVVPTWNYAAAQVYGTATFYLDSKSSETDAFLAKQVSDLSEHAEGILMGYEKTWKVTDAPEKFIELLRKSLIGMEVKVTRLEGKFKMSQELAEGDREGVIKGLEEMGEDELVETVKWRAGIKNQQAKSEGRDRGAEKS